MELTPRKLIFLGFFLAIVILFLCFYFDQEENDLIVQSEAIDVKPSVVSEIELTNVDPVTERAIDSPEINSDVDIGYPKILPVEFSTGEVVTVNFDVDASHKLPRLTADNVDSYLNQLMAMAETGNSAASEALFRSLEDCTQHPRDTSVFRSKLEQFEHSGQYKLLNSVERNFPSINVKSVVGSQEHGSLVNSFKITHRLCLGVPQLIIENRQVWYDKAVELGDYGLLTNLAASYSGVDELKRFEIYQRLWDLGHVAVGYAIADAYQRGVPPLLNGKPDNVQAYAYHLAQNKLFEAILIDSGNTAVANEIAQMDQSLAISGASLTPAEQSAAEKMAIELVKKNPKCCKGLWPLLHQ